MHVPTNLNTPANPSESSSIASPPLDEPTSPQPTQIITIPIRKSATIGDPSSPHGKVWNAALDILEGSEGFRALYWGEHIENELEEEGTGRTQVVIVRDSMDNHHAFLNSPPYNSFLSSLSLLSPKTPKPPTIYHASLSHFTSNPSTLSPPSIPTPSFVTGTAIYLTTSPPSFLKTWSLWTTLIPNIPGCLGCTGGFISESVDGHPAGAGYVVYVGWESVDAHESYHATRDFKRKGVVLSLWNRGWRGYGHVQFLGGRGRIDWGEGGKEGGNYGEGREKMGGKL
ncbi:uncharacterized protein BDV14DRAFT_201522 [Aspergillus stella-maris]|uniref:uncharacterized protein n=1 Tax=Aspergillus stella-maris TaxID=1810926 RepID=UPI003CCD11BB